MLSEQIQKQGSFEADISLVQLSQKQNIRLFLVIRDLRVDLL